MTNVLVTMAFGPYLQIGMDFTFPLIEQYAQRCGFDWFLIDRHTEGRRTSWEAMEHIHRLLGEYERLFFVSVDCVIGWNARNVLDYPTGVFYGFDEYAFDDAPLNEGTCKTVWDYATTVWPEEFPSDSPRPTFLYNTGLMLIDHTHRALFAPVVREVDYGMEDMAVVNMRLALAGTPHRDLRPEVFNATHMWLPEHPTPCFLHVMWQAPLAKYAAVELWMHRMGYSK